MKLVKLSLILAVAVMAIVGLGTTSYAFHDGGVARCEGCHTMHNSFQGGAMAGTGSTTVGAAGTGNPLASKAYLLRGSDQSSTCLNCHESATLGSYRVSTPLATMQTNTSTAPVQRTPGGDFGWVKILTTTSTSKLAERHGHNIVASDFGYVADTKNTTAPGGTFVASQLNCISCHSPHNTLRRTDESGTIASTGAPIAASGSYNNSPVATATAAVGVYRFLGGTGYAPKSYGAAFTHQVPQAVSPSSYNRTEALSDTAVAYGSGMSGWCLNCHPTFDGSSFASGAPNHPHPTDRAIGSMATTYNLYVKTGDMTGVGGGYTSLVPVERGTSDYATLKTAATNTAGLAPAADASSQVMCLSCHRAHASGFESMTRWFVADTLITENSEYAELGVQGKTVDQIKAAYYDRPATVFGVAQRSLCNKCHAKD
jgi:hypothetical protein